MAQNDLDISSVVITGALGSLGWKFMQYLAKSGSIPQVVGLDIKESEEEQREKIQKMIEENDSLEEDADFKFISCDLRTWDDPRWRDAFDEADAVLHFAVQNVWPDAPWSDAMASFKMTVNTATAALQRKRIKRFVCASSNHAMGRYKDPPLSEVIGPYPYGLTTDLEPAPGTVWFNGEEMIDSYKYGSSKVAMETLCRAYAEMAHGSTTFLCVRIGWCQHGVNTPKRITTTWDQDRGEEEENPEQWSRDLRWFKEMWLSDRDFEHLFERAIFADGTDWSKGFLIVNGVSDNNGMAWSLKEAKECLGYKPQDNVYDTYR